MTTVDICSLCGGSGSYSFQPCRECQGTGFIDIDPDEQDRDDDEDEPEPEWDRLEREYGYW